MTKTKTKKPNYRANWDNYFILTGVPLALSLHEFEMNIAKEEGFDA